MDIETERTAEALYQRHRPSHRARAGQTGFASKMGRDRLIDDTEHLRHHLGPRRQQVSQRERHRQHPLTDRLLWQDVVNEQRRRFGHPPRAAARTEAAALATERDQLLDLTGIVFDPQKTMLEQTALEISLELVFNVTRQRPPFGRLPIPKPG